MANVKISDLPAATSLSSSNIFPLVQSSITKQGALSLLPFLWDLGVDVKNVPYSASGNNTADDATAINTADAVNANGGSTYFPRGRYVVGSTISKGAMSNWQGIPGVNPGTQTTDYGSVIVLGFNGAAVTMPTPGTTVYSNYTGFRGISFNSPGIATYASGTGISSNGNVREVVVENANFNGFLQAIVGSWGELYVNRIFAQNCKWGLFSTGLSDSWLTNCHLGSGLSAPSGCSGGSGAFLSGASNITSRGMRYQVQLGGYGLQLRASDKVRSVEDYFDQNESGGIEITNCNQVDLIGAEIFDNGTTSANAHGLLIQAVSDTLTADASTDEITLTSANGASYFSALHTIVQFSNSGGALPTGLSSSTEYYLIAGSGTGKFKVAASYADAVAGTAIDITGAGLGTNSILGVCRDIRVSGGAIYDRNTGTASEKQDVGIKILKTALNGAAAPIIKNITLNGVDLSRVATPVQYTSHVDAGLYITKCPGIREDALAASSDATFRVGENAKNTLFNSVFGADVNITLSQDGAYGGAAFNISRGTSATGAFNLVIKNSAGTTLTSVAADATNVQMVRVVYFAGGTLQWALAKSAGF